MTIFIGGNHEASNYLQELPYGGWVAPNIYYMGYAGVVRYGGLRIGGLSGIYKGPHYLRGHYEKTPYSEDSIRSVYHVRNLEVFRLKQVRSLVPREGSLDLHYRIAFVVLSVLLFSSLSLASSDAVLSNVQPLFACVHCYFIITADISTQFSLSLKL